MFCLRLLSTVWLAAVALLITAGVSAALTPLSTNKVTTCDSVHNVHRLSCESGVILVQTALYGRRDTETCSDGKPNNRVSNVDCSQDGTLDVLKENCDGKTVCEVNTNLVRDPSLCASTYKYMETTFACVSATHSVTCENSIAHLRCDQGQLIHVFGADFGRHDQSTCSFGRPASQLSNVACTSAASASQVAAMCNGRSSCAVSATTSMFGDPCYGTYKYLEVAYGCYTPSL